MFHYYHVMFCKNLTNSKVLVGNYLLSCLKLSALRQPLFVIIIKLKKNKYLLNFFNSLMKFIYNPLCKMFSFSKNTFYKVYVT